MIVPETAEHWLGIAYAVTLIVVSNVLLWRCRGKRHYTVRLYRERKEK